MSGKILGRHFDIHGGGQDLQFPHHENEIAQSEGAHDCKFVNYWLHNGFVRVDNEKMSKSLGNFFTIREILDKFDPEVVRFFILRAHYRSPLNYSDAHLEDAKNALTRLYTALKNVPPAEGDLDWNDQYATRFKAAMNDDFNTPEALAVLFELAGDVNKSKDVMKASLLRRLGMTLGLLERNPEVFFKGPSTSVTLAIQNAFHAHTAENVSLSPGYSENEIDTLIEERLSARKNKDFKRADDIREELKAAGIILEDGPQGTTWRRA